MSFHNFPIGVAINNPLTNNIFFNESKNINDEDEKEVDDSEDLSEDED